MRSSILRFALAPIIFIGLHFGLINAQTVTITTVPNPPTICVGDDITLTANPSGFAGTSYSYLWSPDDETTASITKSPTSTITYTVEVTEKSGQTANALKEVTVTPKVGTPTAITISSGTEPVCQLTNGTTTTSYATTATNSTGFNWSISTPSAGTIDPTTGVMTWANGFSGSVDVQVTANGCNGASPQTKRTVTVTPTPTASVSGTATVCQNSSPLPNITFANTNSLPVTITYKINNGSNKTVDVDANSTTLVSAPTIDYGDFKYDLVSVSYQTAPNCPKIISGSVTITVKDIPASKFKTQLVVGLQDKWNIKDESIPAPNSQIKNWQLKYYNKQNNNLYFDTSFTKKPIYQTKIISVSTKCCLIATDNNGCSDESCQEFNILGDCNLYLSADSISEICLGESIISKIVYDLSPTPDSIDLLILLRNNESGKIDTIRNENNLVYVSQTGVDYTFKPTSSGQHTISIIFSTVSFGDKKCDKIEYSKSLEVNPTPEIILLPKPQNNTILFCKSSYENAFKIEDQSSVTSSTFSWNFKNSPIGTNSSITLDTSKTIIKLIKQNNTSGCTAALDLKIDYKNYPNIILDTLPCLPYIQIKGLKIEDTISSISTGKLVAETPFIDITGVQAKTLVLLVSNDFCSDTASIALKGGDNFATIDLNEFQTYTCNDSTNFIYPVPGLCYEWGEINAQGVVTFPVDNPDPKQQFIKTKSGSRYFVRTYDCNKPDCGKVTEPRSVDESATEEHCGDNKTLKVNLFPNPNTGDFTVYLAEHKQGMYQIFVADMLGRQVIERKYQLASKESLFPFTLNSFSQGMYSLIIITPDGQVRNIPFIIIQ